MTDQELIEYLQERQWLKPEQLDYCIRISQEKKLPLLQILYQEHHLSLNQITPEVLGTSVSHENASELLENLLKTKLSVETSEPNSENDLAPPALSSGRYEVIENLGSGGMGVVQRVLDRSLGREVALKKIKCSPSGKSKMPEGEHILLERLKREASITAVLEHPNIIPLYDLQEEESGEIFFTMRKIEGQTLREILKDQRNGKTDLDESRLLSIFLKVCDAIRYAHSRNIIHRDLKPDNIMVGAFGEVYVMDWGLAKKMNPGSSETSKIIKESLREVLGPIENEVSPELRTIGGIGTPGYMSPEQSENAKEVYFPTDIYSLGKILRECFTFLSPIEEIRFSLTQHQQETSKKIDPQKKSKASLLDKQVPPEIQAIIQKATQEKPLDRYLSVLALEEDIERYQKNMRVLVKEYGPLEAFTKWLQRNRQTLVIVFFLLLVGILFGFYAQWKGETLAEKEFQENCQGATIRRTEAEKIHADPLSIEAAAKKLEHLLQAFNLLNRALEIKPNDPVVLKEKYETGEALIQVCCITKDYQLAEFVLKKIGDDPTRTETSTPRLKEQIENSRNATVKYYLERIRDIETRFKTKERQKGDVEEAIFEISRMDGEDVLKKLVTLLQEGTTYLREQENRDPKVLEFYQMIAESLGRIENTSVNESLFGALQEIGKKAQSFPQEKEVPSDLTEYMVILAYALKNNHASEYALEFQALWNQFKGRPFSQRTLPVLEDLLQNFQRLNKNKPPELKSRSGDEKK